MKASFNFQYKCTIFQKGILVFFTILSVSISNGQSTSLTGKSFCWSEMLGDRLTTRITLFDGGRAVITFLNEGGKPVRKGDARWIGTNDGPGGEMPIITLNLSNGGQVKFKAVVNQYSNTISELIDSRDRIYVSCQNTTDYEVDEMLGITESKSGVRQNSTSTLEKKSNPPKSNSSNQNINKSSQKSIPSKSKNFPDAKTHSPEYIEKFIEIERLDSIYKSDSTRWSPTIRQYRRNEINKLRTELINIQNTH